MMSAASSSSATPFSKESYDVFISFRGEDTRRNFVTHLDDALCQKAIKTYKDDRTLEKGDEVWPALVQAIDNSHLCIVVFSKHYASSTWCLRELTHILGCKKERQVLPVFYQIDPSHIRKQMGSYKEAFDKHEKDHKLDEKTVLEWRDSLKKVADFSGFDSESHLYRDDIELIENIVKDVWQKLEPIYPPIAERKGLVGIDKNIADMEKFLGDFGTIGLWGMGGIGKTTIAKALFEKYSYSSQYTGRCFLKCIRENSRNLESLRKELLKDLFKGDNINIDNALIERKLESKTVFIVLDDVDASEQIDYLVKEIDCFGPGSRIIITSRDKDVFSGKVDKIHPVERLDSKASLQLFSLSAFKIEHPQKKFRELSQKVVKYAQGLPLALKLLGSYLHSRSSKEAWESALEKLKKYSHKGIDNVLKLSYKGLDKEEKEIFLDIAFFFKGEKKDDVQRFLNACGFSAADGLKVLEDKALISISNRGEVEMHDLIEEMGWRRVHERMKYTGRCSRLKNPKEIYDMLKNNTGSDAVEGIMLDLCEIGDLHLNGDVFKNMTKLRFLKFYFPSYWNGLWRESKVSKVYPSGLESFSNSLRYFRWDAYPPEYLPQTLCLENLVMLDIRNSPIKNLGDGARVFANLRDLSLIECNQLIKLPNFSKALNLESIHLGGCRNLRHVPTFYAKSLVYLNLSESRIKKCWDRVLNLVNLKKLLLYGCKELIELPDLSRASKLEELSVSMCENLRDLHSSVLTLQSLHELDLFGCKKLSFRSLQNVILSHHPKGSVILPNVRDLLLCNTPIKTLPSSIGGCINLQGLFINNSSLENLPPCIKDLPSLLYLDISRCKGLRCLPELPPSLIGLYADDCTSLKTVITPRTLKFCTDFQIQRSTLIWKDATGMFLANCMKLDEHSLNAIAQDARERIKLATTHQCDLLTNCELNIIYFCFPGNSVPRWIRYKEMGGSINIELPPPPDLLGFAFSVVIYVDVSFSSYEYRKDSSSNDPSYEYDKDSSSNDPSYEYDKDSSSNEEDSSSNDPLFEYDQDEDSSSNDEHFGPMIEIVCKCYLDGSKIVSSCYVAECPYDGNRISLSDHVIMWYNEDDSKALTKAIRNMTPEHTSYNSKLSFQFFASVRDVVSCKLINLNDAVKECGVWRIYASEGMEESLDHKTNICDNMDCPAKKFNPSLLPKALESELGSKSHRYEDINKMEAGTSGIAAGGSEFQHDRHDFTEINFNSLLDHESDKMIVPEYQNSKNRMELALEAYEEQQLPLIENFTEAAFQTVVPKGLELDSNTGTKKHLVIEEIKVGNSYHESQDDTLLQTEECISQPPTTPTKMHNDYQDLSETFTVGSFIGMAVTFFF